MSVFVPPSGQESGEASRFTSELEACWDFFASYDTPEPILLLSFDDGQHGGAQGLDDVPGALVACLSHYFGLPHSGSLHAVGTVFSVEPSFDMHIAYEGIDGPLVVRFSDGTLLTGMVSSEVTERWLSKWDAGVIAGIVQMRIEEIVTLALLAELPSRLTRDDREIAEALLGALGRISKTDNPPRHAVREMVRWLGGKLDLFIDEAAKTGGKVAGVVAVGAAGWGASRHFPSLANHIAEFLDIAR